MREIKISQETAERWYNGTDEELKQLVVQTYPELVKVELPKTWEKLKKIKGWYADNSSRLACAGVSALEDNRNVFATKEQAEASIALAQLSQLMKAYNGYWKTDWSSSELKFCITFFNSSFEVQARKHNKVFLSFKDKETAVLFFENFRDLIEQAKPLL